MDKSKNLVKDWNSDQNPGLKKQVKFWKSRWRSLLMRSLEKVLIGESLSSLVVQDLSSLSRHKSAMEYVESIELLEESELVPRTFQYGGREFPNFKDTRRAIFRYQIKDAVVHLESGLANVCGGFMVEELMGSLTAVFGGGTAVHEYASTKKPTKRIKGYWTVLPTPRFYFHFIAQSLPTLLRALEHTQLQGVIASDALPNWARESLSALKIEVVYLPDKSVEIEHFVCCSVPQITSSSDVNLLRTAYSDNLQKAGKGLAFIGRSGRNRNLGQVEHDLAIFIQSLGGVVIEPESFRWEEELEFFSGIDRLIFVNGSVSANVVWMKPGSKVLVLCGYESFSAQIEKSMFLAASISCTEYNTDGLTLLSDELVEEITHFVRD